MMTKLILNAIKAEYQSGRTQEQIARDHNISHVVVNRILSGKRSVGGLTLNTVCKMFPKMSVNLNGGECPVVVADNNSIAVNDGGHHNNFFNGGLTLNEYSQKIIDAVMASEKFDPAVKVELYSIVKKVGKENV